MKLFQPDAPDLPSRDRPKISSEVSLVWSAVFCKGRKNPRIHLALCRVWGRIAFNSISYSAKLLWHLSSNLIAEWFSLNPIPESFNYHRRGRNPFSCLPFELFQCVEVLVYLIPSIDEKALSIVKGFSKLKSSQKLKIKINVNSSALDSFLLCHEKLFLRLLIFFFLESCSSTWKRRHCHANIRWSIFLSFPIFPSAKRCLRFGKLIQSTSSTSSLQSELKRLKARENGFRVNRLTRDELDGPELAALFKYFLMNLGHQNWWIFINTASRARKFFWRDAFRHQTNFTFCPLPTSPNQNR